MLNFLLNLGLYFLTPGLTKTTDLLNKDLNSFGIWSEEAT